MAPKRSAVSNDEIFDVVDTPIKKPVVQVEEKIQKSQLDKNKEKLDAVDSAAHENLKDSFINPPSHNIFNLNADEFYDGQHNTESPRKVSQQINSQTNEKKDKVSHKTERKDSDGITFIHTRFDPIEPKENYSDIKYQLNSDTFYEMNTFPRGVLTIINVRDFKESSGLKEYPRDGTDRDAESLCKLFLDLGFIVDRFDNPCCKDIEDILEKAAKKNYRSMSCCAVAVLTHGEEGIVYGTDGSIKIRDITKLFSSRSLAGKPKLFLFQACRGSEYMNSHDAVDGPGSSTLQVKSPQALELPSESDFLYAYCTVPGYFAWRNSLNGSWFIEAVTSVFREYAHKMDVVRLLTRVNEDLSQRKSKTKPKHISNDKRQIASIVTQMRKELFLMPIYGPLETIS